MFSVVLVTYNSAQVVADAIRSVPAGNEIIVVDNASRDDSVEIARSLGAIVIENAENLGFGSACNIGAARASAERLFFLNPDARVEPDTLDHLARAMDADPRSAAFNPRIVEPDGRQFFRRRTKLIPRPYLLRMEVPTCDRYVYFACGAALAMRTKDFVELGGFDERIFLYYEDDDITARIIKAGKKVLYVHDAITHHMVGKSCGNSMEGLYFKFYHELRAKRYTYKKHGKLFFRHMRIAIEYGRKMLFRGDETELRTRICEARLHALLEPPVT